MLIGDDVDPDVAAAVQIVHLYGLRTINYDKFTYQEVIDLLDIRYEHWPPGYSSDAFRNLPRMPGKSPVRVATRPDL